MLTKKEISTHKSKANILPIDILDFSLAESFKHVVQDHSHTCERDVCERNICYNRYNFLLMELTIV